MKRIVITGEDSMIDILVREQKVRVLRGKLTIEDQTDTEKKVVLSKPEKAAHKPASKPAAKPVGKPSGKTVGKAITPKPVVSKEAEKVVESQN